MYPIILEWNWQKKKKAATGGPAANKTTPKKGKKGANTGGKAAKVAQVVGTAKAKREALQAKKRGLNATGKATKMDIDKAVKKQMNKIVGGIFSYLIFHATL